LKRKEKNRGGRREGEAGKGKEGDGCGAEGWCGGEHVGWGTKGLTQNLSAKFHHSGGELNPRPTKVEETKEGMGVNEIMPRPDET